MKKTYSEPDILFESFTLSTNIAAGCEERPNDSTDDCGVLFGRQKVFLESMTGCLSKLKDGENSYDNLCYHNPYGGYNVFYS